MQPVVCVLIEDSEGDKLSANVRDSHLGIGHRDSIAESSGVVNNDMTIGAFSNVSEDQSIISQGDSAELRAYIYSEDNLPVEADEIASVSFAVQNSKGERTTYPGTIEEDGSGFYRYLDTEEMGRYVWVARFTLVSGQIQSYRGQFIVVDPFQQTASDDYQAVAEAVWARLEDCFDSQEGGPWLRDMSLRMFDKNKIPQFVNDGMLLINMTGTITEFPLKYFFPREEGQPISLDYTENMDSFIIVQATLLSTIRHLMRSYVEQPDLVGANAVRETRRDYLQRWQLIYEIEKEAFEKALGLWKRQFLTFGHTKMLVHNKAGRAGGPGQSYMRTRNVGRGGWGY